MNKRDYYQVLGLSPNCTSQDVKKNFHRLALIWHPDKHNDKSEAEHKFMEIQEAYAVLTDPKKRKVYDSYGHQGLSMNQEMTDFANANHKNCFYQKGFHGSKSAFDILRGIFEENDDDDFFSESKGFGFSDNFKSTVQSFIEETLIESENDDTNMDNFFENYTPSFVDTGFLDMPSFFQPGGLDSEFTSHFSFFSSVDSNINNVQSFSRSSTTVLHNGKVKTSTKQRYQKNGTVFENEENHEYDAHQQQTPMFNIEDIPENKTKKRRNKKDSQVIIVDDDDDSKANKKNTRAKNNNSLNEKAKKLEELLQKDKPIYCQETQKKSRMLDMETLADDEVDLTSEYDFKCAIGNYKKNKR